MRFMKAILALIGGLTPAFVVAVSALFGATLDAVTVATVLGGLSPLLATLAVAIGPANTSAGPVLDPIYAEDVDRGI